MTNQEKHARLKWAMENPELAAFESDAFEMLSYLALKGIFIDGATNKDVLFDMHKLGQKLFNTAVDALEKDSGVTDYSVASQMLVDVAYSEDSLRNAFYNTVHDSQLEEGSMLARKAQINFSTKAPDDLKAICDPQWWTFRVLDWWMRINELYKTPAFE
jgi:hypothetical protein